MSYCFKIILCVINMKLCWDILIQQDFLKQIGDIQDIDSFKHTWKIFDICAIMILGYEHTLLVHYILSFNIYVNNISLYNKSSRNWKIFTWYWLS
jgi:hypothetical protein